MARPKPAEIQELRDANDRLHQLADVYQLPFIEPLEFIDTVLAMGNTLPTTQEKADAFHLFMHGLTGDSYEWWTSDFCEASGSDFESGNSDLERAPISEVGQSELNGLVSTQASLLREIDTFWEEHTAQRHEYRNMLDLVYGGKSGDTETYLNRNYKNIVLIPTVNWAGSGPELTIRYCPVGIRGFLVYALALLVDRRTNLSQYLRICNLESCDNYFLSKRMPRNKKRNLKYCSDAHTRAGKAKKNAESSAAYREKQAKKIAKNESKRAKK